MKNAFSSLTSFIPADIDIISMCKFIAVLVIGFLVVGLIFRLFLGKHSNLNHAVSSAIGIFFLYAITIVVYTCKPGNLAEFLAPLPYAGFSGNHLYLFSFRNAGLAQICSQILSMIILAFLVNLLDSCIPRGKKLSGWVFYRLLGIAMSLVVHYASVWVFNHYLPGVLVAYAPMILLVLLVGSLLIGMLNILLSVVLAVVNPIIGALYAFFFSSMIGKQVSKSILSTLILTAVVVLLEHFGYSVINISFDVLGSYVPLIAALTGLWYLIGNIL